MREHQLRLIPDYEYGPTVRVSVSIPNGLVRDLDLVAGSLKCSRSAVISTLLHLPLRDLVGAIDYFGTSVVEGDDLQEETLRMRGKSIELLRVKLERLLSMYEQVRDD